MTFGSFIVGVCGIATGLLLLKYREQVKDFFGNIDFADDIFGQGGTWTLINILGILIPILSIMWMFGTLQSFITNTFKQFF